MRRTDSEKFEQMAINKTKRRQNQATFALSPCGLT
jgi:hypothetical protein